MLKIITLLMSMMAVMLLPLSATAYDFMVDDLAYNITGSNTVEVTYTDYYTVYWNDTYDINYSGLTDANIPTSVSYNGTTYFVTSIGDHAFDGSGLTKVTIPNSITTIGKWAFAYCHLTSVIIPNSVTNISEGAFCGCWGLTSVTIPNSVTYIGFGAFSGCHGLSSVTIPNSVTSIGYTTFQACI